MMTDGLTEPVTCSGCGAVSVNGGTLYCATCYRKLEAEVERLTPYVEAVRRAGNLARAVEACIGGGDIAMRGHALNALHAYLAHITKHNLLPEDAT